MELTGLAILLMQIGIAVACPAHRQADLVAACGHVLSTARRRDLLPGGNPARIAVEPCDASCGQRHRQAVNPDGALHRRAEDLAVCGSIDNKLALAARMYRARPFRRGNHAFRERPRWPVCRCTRRSAGPLPEPASSTARLTAARSLLERIATAHPDYYPQDVAILKARAADAMAIPRLRCASSKPSSIDRLVLKHATAMARFSRASVKCKRRATSSRTSSTMPDVSASVRPSGPWAKRSRALLASLG